MGIFRTFLYEPHHTLCVQNIPIDLLSFQPRDTTKFKWWSIAAKCMRQNQQQERRAKSDRLSTIRIYFDITLVTSISPTSDCKTKCLTNSSPDGTLQPTCKTTVKLTPHNPVQIPCKSGQKAHLPRIYDNVVFFALLELSEYHLHY